MKPIFESIAHIGIVVKNLDDTLSNYSEKYGIGPWSIYNCDFNNVKDMAVYKKNINYRFKFAYCKLGETAFEIIQPLDEKSI